jgi:hypothetical protein
MCHYKGLFTKSNICKEGKDLPYMGYCKDVAVTNPLAQYIKVTDYEKLTSLQQLLNQSW